MSKFSAKEVGVGHSAMPSSFVGFVCGWFSKLSNPSCSVFATQGVYSSGSVKRSLSLDRRIFLVSSSFVQELLVRYSFFWFRNTSSEPVPRGLASLALAYSTDSQLAG